MILNVRDAEFEKMINFMRKNQVKRFRIDNVEIELAE